MDIKDLERKYPEFEFIQDRKSIFATDGTCLFASPSPEQLDELIRKHNESK